MCTYHLDMSKANYIDISLIVVDKIYGSCLWPETFYENCNNLWYLTMSAYVHVGYDSDHFCVRNPATLAETEKS